jgi:hypothetical protein
MKDEIVAKLDSLAELQAKQVLLDREKQAKKDAILTPALCAALSAIDTEFLDRYSGIDAEAAALEAAIKDGVLAEGASIKGSHLHAIWSAGRVTWETKALDGFIVSYPELEKFRKVGQPSVAIRKV